MIGSLRTIWHRARGHRVTLAPYGPTGLLYRSCSCGDRWWRS